MKKKIVLFLFIGIISVIVYAYHGGAAAQGGIDGSGASGPGGCGQGCHGSTSANGTVIQLLDGGGTAVTSYQPGTSYTVKISATNATGAALPAFGFQLAAVLAAGAGTNPVDAGTWGGSLPTNVQNTPASVSQLTETVIEQATQITATTGTGANGTTYVESIPWTAPAAGTGNVIIYGVINAVNNNGRNSGDFYQMASSLTITEGTVAPLVASVTIALTSGTSPACAGSSFTFTATPTNGGSAPTYQWKVNGTNAGTGNPFTSTTLTNGQVVTCVMTSNLSGVTGSPATSNGITASITSPVTPSISITPSGTTICSGSTVSFTSAVNNASSPTYQWKLNGNSIAGATGSTYSANTFVNGDVVTCSITTGQSCVTSSTATSGGVAINVTSSVAPSVSITATATSICPGTNVTFTAMPVNGGSAPSYQWNKNGASITGATSSTYSSSTLANGDVITVSLTSNAGCVSPSGAISNSLTISAATVTPSVSIVSNSGSSICANQSVQFTATPTNGGASPSYQWTKNGSNITGSTFPVYTDNTLVNGDAIAVVMTSGLACASPATATSNSISMTIVTNAVASVSISASPGNTICFGQNVTFTATPVNGGTSPTYQWQVNGNNISGATSVTYSSSSFANGDVIAVLMHSNSLCVTSSSATSAPITISLSASVTPAVTITSSATGSICSGDNVTFTASPVNGGSSPAYQWLLNGSNISGATYPGYSTTSLVNGDAISVVMTSGSACASPSTATSNAITTNVSAGGTAAVSISAATGTSVCSGQSVTFTATPVNGGSSPSFQWKANGVPVAGATTGTYTFASVNNGDVISLSMTSNSPCVARPVVQSNSVTMSVTAGGTPLLSISSTNGLSLCQGVPAAYKAVSVLGGSSPTYQWQKNGTNVGGNSTVYIDNAVVSGDVVTCKMTSSLSCANPSNVVSNSLHMIVNPLPAADITVNGNTLVASQAFSYQWYFNNIAVSGGTSRVLVPASNGSYTVDVTDAHGCQNTSSAFDVTFAGVSEISPLSLINVYPNPTEGAVSIDLTGVKDDGRAMIKISDTNGRLLLEKTEALEQKVVLDLNSLQSGIYLVQISLGNSSTYKKLVLSR